MEALGTYASCGLKGRLASEGAGFMKKELTVKDALDIDAKLTTQPYVPPVGAAGLVWWAETIQGRASRLLLPIFSPPLTGSPNHRRAGPGGCQSTALT